MESLIRTGRPEPPASQHDIEPWRRPGAGRDFLAAVFRRRSRMLQIFIAALVLVAAAIFLRPRLYETRARILVKYTSEYVYRPQVGEARLPIALAPEEILNSEISILTSEGLVREVIQEIGAEKLYPGAFGLKPSIDDAMNAFRKNLNVEGIRRSTILQVTFAHPDPQLSARALHELVERFEQKHVNVYSEGALAFLEDQLRMYAQKLRKSDERLEAFRQKHGVFEYGEQMALLLRERSALQAAHRESGVALAQYQRQIEPLRKSLEGPHPPDVIGAIQTDMIRLEGEAQARRSRLASVGTQIEELDEKIREMERNERQLASIRRDIAQDEKNYEAYRTRVEEMRVASALGEQSISNISVIDPGSVPVKPAGPRRALKLVVAAILAGLTAVIYAFIAEYLSQAMATPEDVERRLRLPVLTSVERFG